MSSGGGAPEFVLVIVVVVVVVVAIVVRVVCVVALSDVSTSSFKLRQAVLTCHMVCHELVELRPFLFAPSTMNSPPTTMANATAPFPQM